uniref:EF-hand domain-containing protein n=1 Tax=Eutreptiella gymnastica TaxID=73025 RepID=A0A7S4D3Y6_9EUGL
MREAHATMKAKVKSMELEMSQMQTREERLFEERMRKDDTIQHLQHQQQGLMKELRQAKEKLETALAKIEHKDTSQHKARVWNLVDEPQGALQGLDLKDVVSAFDEGTRGEYRLMKCRTESSVVNGLLVFLRYSLPDFAGAEVGNALSAGSPRDTETKIAAIMAAFRALDLPNLDAVRSLLRSALHKSNLTASHNYPLYALIAYLGKVTMYSLDLKEADKRKFQKETGWKEPGVSASWRAIDMIEALVDATSVRPVGQDIGIQCNEVEQCDEEEEALFTHYADKLDLDLDGDVLPTDAAQAEGYLNAIRQCLKECIGGLHSVFMYYCSSDKKYHGMNEHEFWRFCRDLEVYKNCADQRTRVKKIFLVALSGEDHTEGPGRSELSQSGWVKTLIWMANETMASYGRLPERVAAFVDRILANSKRFKVQGFRNMIYGKQVQRVADAFRKRLLRVFHVYSDRDRKMMTQSAFKSLCKDAVLIDSIFTHDAVQDVFQHSQLEEEDDGMLIFSEFQEALIAIALYKNPNPYTSMDRRVEYFFEKQLLLPLKHKLK